jgi:hypothetical protein
MSAKGRGKKTNTHAFYPTDPRLVRAVLRAIDAGQGPPLVGLNQAPDPCDPIPLWADPCAGDGAIVRAVESYRPGGREWLTADIRHDAAADIVGDFRNPVFASGADVYITNPPYGDDEADGVDPNRERDLALAFASGCVEKCAVGGNVLLLVRFGFFTALRRLSFVNARRWDVWPISPRPSFGVNALGKKGTDATEYVWIRTGPKVEGRFFPTLDWRLS